MEKQKSFLKRIGLTAYQISQWQNLQRNLAAVDLFYLESDATMSISIWSLYPISKHNSLDIYQDNLNNIVQKKEKRIKDKIETIISHAIFLFPANDLLLKKDKVWKEILESFSFWRKFKFDSFFRSISDYNDFFEISWQFVQHYKAELSQGENNTQWFTKYVITENHKGIPLVELFVFLLIHIELGSSRKSISVFNNLLGSANELVQAFFKNNKTLIRRFIKDNTHVLEVEGALKLLLPKLLNKKRAEESIITKAKRNSQSYFPDADWSLFVDNSEISSEIVLLNALTNPLIKWKETKEGFIPFWNIFNEKNERLKNYMIEEQHHQQDSETLEFYKKELDIATGLDAIRKLKKEYIYFYFIDFQEKWDALIERKELDAIRKEKLKIERMQTYGILKVGDTNFSKKENAYYEEMIAIENEVSDYINYVRESFNSAIPTRKKVVFDYDRTSIDGVEFDPMSVFEPEKWLTGNIMRSMKYDIAHGEIEQLNVFCLDYSGSMQGIRMRNLFKVLYLLVLALEDKTSYDAFHFFSNKFIEGIDFSSDYTNRIVLYKILKTITSYRYQTIHYEGLDGTNISSGINGCYERLVSFREQLLQENPSKNIVSSMFVITDGRPSLGVVNTDKLNRFIENKRKKGNISIKGIYIHEDTIPDVFISQIFGEDQYTQSNSFENAVHQFVNLMTETYKMQRKDFKWEQKRAKLQGK